MENNTTIDISNNSDIDEKIKIIMNQTDYNYDSAKNLMREYNNDYILIIKKYLNIEKKPKKIKH